MDVNLQIKSTGTKSPEAEDISCVRPMGSSDHFVKYFAPEFILTADF